MGKIILTAVYCATPLTAPCRLLVREQRGLPGHDDSSRMLDVATQCEATLEHGMT